MAAEQFIGQEAALRQALAGEKPSALTLPNLAPVPNALEEWWSRLVEKIGKWIVGLLRPLNFEVRLNPGDVGAYFRYTLIAILAGAVLYLLYRIISDGVVRRRVLHLVGAPDMNSPTPVIEPDRLEHELSAAIQAGNYSLAARVRWIVFLFQNRMPTALTLLDYATLHPGARSQLFPHYALMFREGYNREPLYREFEKTLSGLSSPTLSAGGDS